MSHLRLAALPLIAAMVACAPAPASEPPSAPPFHTAPLVRQTITPAPTPVGSRTPEVLSGTVTVEMGDEFFLPTAITVTVGTTVTWVNRGQNAHTATARDGSFESPTLDFGGRYSFTFMKRGRYAYTCSFHADMFGDVIVV